MANINLMPRTCLICKGFILELLEKGITCHQPRCIDDELEELIHELIHMERVNDLLYLEAEEMLNHRLHETNPNTCTHLFCSKCIQEIMAFIKKTEYKIRTCPSCNKSIMPLLNLFSLKERVAADKKKKKGKKKKLAAAPPDPPLCENE